jgi:acetyl-CoA synthetase
MRLDSGLLLRHPAYEDHDDPIVEALIPIMSNVTPQSVSRSAPTFQEARDLLLDLHDEYSAAKTSFAWPRPERFNWALDWFDAERAAGEHGAKCALKILGERDETRTFAELSLESSCLANGLRALGAKRGNRLLVMLGATPELWVTMLAAMKLGLVLIPAMQQLGTADIADRFERGAARFLVAHGADAEKFAGIAAKVERIAVGERRRPAGALSGR